MKVVIVMSSSFLRFASFLTLFVFASRGSALNEFDDSVLFRVAWPGPNKLQPDDGVSVKDVMVLTTANNEKYECVLPKIDHNNDKKDHAISEENPWNLLMPLFSQTSCSYRLEQYWTYELCHGRYVKQYHDEKDATDSKRLIRQEFTLGKFNEAEAISEMLQNKAKSEPKEKSKIPTKKINKLNLPYFEVVMMDGTICDLNNKKRSTRVLYICDVDSDNEIFAMEEVASCEYEMIVLTPLLCSHSDYRVKEVVEHDIQCHSLEGSPKRPLQLEKFDLENLHFVMKQRRKQTSFLRKLRQKILEEVAKKEDTKVQTQEADSPNDLKLMEDFLSGQHCLYGGTGWWKFEFCNGKKVVQYHEYDDKRRIEVTLGIWDKEKHLNWIHENPHKRPKKSQAKVQTSHLYTGGSICDVTGKQRQVEVKFKCKDSTSHPNAVSLYLLEPKTCEYILVVESSILCSLIESTDENGLFTESR